MHHCNFISKCYSLKLYKYTAYKLCRKTESLEVLTKNFGQKLLHKFAVFLFKVILKG